MNKTAIRNFAVWARNKLIADVSYRAGLMGVTKEGISQALPQSTKDAEFYDIGIADPYVIRGDEIKQRKGLVGIIESKAKDSDYETAYKSVMEEVAYTWFNRLIAVRFMEVNDYLPAHVRVLSSESGKSEPDIVTTPFDSDLFYKDGEQQEIIQLKNDNKLDEVFRILFIKQCNALAGILPRLFEKMSDYTELLLNVSYIDQDGVLYHLVHDIPEDDFNIEKGGQVEIIGWLYQYYNAELKDETFALLKNNVKVTKERIPSATQLFTPDWIVRYMVENSLGRLWVEGHPNKMLRSGWKYYLDEAEQEEPVKLELQKIREEYTKINPEDIKVIDPCMGSGHILVYAFDVLMQIYESAGYTQRDAAKSILEHNLFGLDIDDRAAQLSYFAVMMKARQYNRRILDGETNCNVYAIKESNNFDREALVKIGDDLRPVAERLLDAFVDAKEYGSIITVDVTVDELDALANKLDDVDRMAEYGNLLDMMYADILCTELDALVKQACVMVQKYDVVITNPPYMNGSGMSTKLSEFVKRNYSIEKADLYSCCMKKGLELVKSNRFMAMITMEGWMFINSLKDFRINLVDCNTIQSLVHMPYLGRGGTSLGINFGTCAFVLFKGDIPNFRAEYNYIRYYELDEKLVPVHFPLVNERRSWKAKKSYELIPNGTLCYWASDQFIKSYEKEKISKYAISDGQTKTGDNGRYLRCLWEVNSLEVGKNKKWVLLAKGGLYRKWYGNIEYLIDWSEQSRKHYKEDHVARIAPEYIWFRKGVSWNHVTSNERFSARILKEDMLFETAAPSVFFEREGLLIYIVAFLNTKVAESMIKLINPTMCTNVGDITCQPIVVENEKEHIINNLSSKCIDISKVDWDSFENSWDFKKHPLV